MVTKTHGLDLTISKLSLMFTERMKGATLSAVKKKKKHGDGRSCLVLDVEFSFYHWCEEKFAFDVYYWGLSCLWCFKKKWPLVFLYMSLKKNLHLVDARPSKTANHLWCSPKNLNWFIAMCKWSLMFTKHANWSHETSEVSEKPVSESFQLSQMFTPKHTLPLMINYFWCHDLIVILSSLYVRSWRRTESRWLFFFFFTFHWNALADGGAESCPVFFLPSRELPEVDAERQAVIRRPDRQELRLRRLCGLPAVADQGRLFPELILSRGRKRKKNCAQFSLMLTKTHLIGSIKTSNEDLWRRHFLCS